MGAWNIGSGLNDIRLKQNEVQMFKEKELL